MENEFIKAIEEYKKRHPEIEEIMKKFQISNEVYQQALAAMSIKIKVGPTYQMTTQGKYNANVSAVAR